MSIRRLEKKIAAVERYLNKRPELASEESKELLDLAKRVRNLAKLDYVFGSDEHGHYLRYEGKS